MDGTIPVEVSFCHQARQVLLTRPSEQFIDFITKNHNALTERDSVSGDTLLHTAVAR